jgi:hypothetical protein
MVQVHEQVTPAALRVRISESVRDAISDDGAILLDVENGACLSLNSVGARIWEMLKKKCPGEEILSALKDQFEAVPISQLEHDYLDFVNQLQANKLACIKRE